MLTKEQWDKVHELYQTLWEDIHDFVDTHTSQLTPEEDEELRQKMTEEFRFWRRMK